MVFRRLVPMNMDFPGSGPGQATVKPGMTAMGANRGSCRALSGFLQQLVTPSFRSDGPCRSDESSTITIR
jgi:hypothetical protein